jgi:hypothetical protein
MFRFNPYNFTITIDEAIQPAGIPTDTTQVFDPKYKPTPYAGPLAGKPGYRENLLGPGVFKKDGTALVGAKRATRIAFTNDAGKRETQSFSGLAAVQQAPIQQNVRANILASQQARSATMTPQQKTAMLMRTRAKLAAKSRGTGANPGTPPVISPTLPPPPTGAGSPPPLPPPPVGTSTTTPIGVSDRQERFMKGSRNVTDAISGMGNSWAKQHPNRRPDRYGDPGQLLYGGIKAAVSIYNSMKTPGTPGSAATSTTPAVAATPGRFDPRAGTRLARAGAGVVLGNLVAGPVGGLLGAGIGALTARRKPIPEERYYRVYKMISQHDHR